MSTTEGHSVNDLAKVYHYPVNVNGSWVLRMPSHRAIQYMQDPISGWERERLAAMHEVIRPDSVVMDIGAEQGDMTALLASWAHTGALVAIEPNPWVWPCIKAIFDENDLTPPAATYVGFVGADPLIPSNPDGLRRGFFHEWPDCARGVIDPAAGFAHMAQEQDRIPTTTIDALVSKTGLIPDVITMDTEGSEWHVLRGATRTLTVHRPTVFVSVHEDFLRDMYGQTPEDVHTLMAKAGYNAELLAVDHEAHWRYTPR